MSLVNKYLEETPLTSTKNKYIENIPLIDSFERFQLEEPLRKKIKYSELLFPTKCHLKNEILLKSECSEWKDDSNKKKKKKKKSRRVCSPLRALRSVSRSRSPSRALRSVSRSISENCDVDCSDIIADETDDRSRDRDSFFKAPVDLGSAFPANFAAPPVMLGYAPVSPVMFGSAPGGRALFRSSRAAKKSYMLSATIPQNSGEGFSFGSLQDNFANIPENFISKMPSYNLKVLTLYEESVQEFLSFDVNANNCSENFMSNIREKKMQLLNVVSMALLYPTNLANKNDNYRETLEKSANDIRLFDPEFILKVALYARQELHIRTVTNFLLSYAATYENTRLYLKKYFEASIVLPSDWIQVAEYFQALNSENAKVPFPAALRRVMKKTFSKFDQYQLAKYNRDKTKSKKNKKNEASNMIEKRKIESEDEKMDDEDESSSDTEAGLGSSEKKVTMSAVNYTLKKLIRIFHIDSPTEHVMCLLGKKYPNSHGEFKLSGLPGTWDSTKAGTRMKLPVPETWETKLPMLGNVPSAWESLIDNNKLPYMATLRNLKNLILSGISPLHHKKVITHLENKKAVINSRQLPMQFFEAFKVISDLENMLVDNTDLDMKAMKMPSWKKRQVHKTKSRLSNASDSVIKQYKNAISNALEISSLNNLHPVPGKTALFCIIDPSKQDSVNKFKLYETCLMMGLMCLKACEDCKMNILCASDSVDVISLNENDKFLDVMMEICEKYKKVLAASEHLPWDKPCSAFDKLLDNYLRPQTMTSMKMDHVILLSNSTEAFQPMMTSFLHKYRHIVNPNLLYTCVNFSIKKKSFSPSSFSEKDVYLCGSSSSLIRFIAERSSDGQLTYIDNVDMKYDLPKISGSKKVFHNIDTSSSDILPDSNHVVPLNIKMPKWHTIRIFISSTFKDMMSERNLLIKYVFPELQRRASSVFVRIAEIDLRWGISEADSSTQRAAELCLLEAQKADLFVGLIGDRYGTVYNFDPPTAPELQWVKECPEGLSITALEMHAAALRDPQSSRGKAFFYFRDNSFVRHVPQKWTSHFTCEDLNSKKKY